MSRGLGKVQASVIGILYGEAELAAGDAHFADGTASAWELAWVIYGHSAAGLSSSPSESQVRSVRRALLSLQQSGDVERASHGRYRLSHDGLMQMKAAKALQDPDVPRPVQGGQ